MIVDRVVAVAHEMGCSFGFALVTIFVADSGGCIRPGGNVAQTT